MKRFALLLLFSSSAWSIGTAHSASAAAPHPLDIRAVVRASVTVPPAWDGVWDTLDSTYDCSGVLQSTDTGRDTLCGGKDYTSASGGSPITFDCTGTANATTIDVTCTGSFIVIADCTENFTIVTHASLSGGTYHSVSFVNVTISGTDPLCGYLTASCTQLDTWGTYVGPAPGAYCATPVRTSTWGGLKSIYR